MRAKAWLVEAGEIGQLRSAQFIAGGKSGFAAGLRKLVPGAGGKAVVAAVNAIADGLAKRVRDRSLVLDGQIGDAAPRVELVRRRECRGWTDVETGAAGAAMIWLRRVV